MDLSKYIKQFEEYKNSGKGDIDRSAFLYTEPKNIKSDFAQCGTCIFFTGSTCYIHGKDIEVTYDMSCGVYVEGKPNPKLKGKEKIIFKPEESGAVKRQVRCENCRSFNGENCALFKTLNEKMPNIFNLDIKVDKNGCCNAQMPKE